MTAGERVTVQGAMEGEVITQEGEQVHVYLGTIDGKRVERWFPEDEVSPSQHKTAQQQLDDLI